MQTNETTIIDEIRRIVNSHLPQYNSEKMKVISLSGLTNMTFKVTCEDQPSLIFRKFGGDFNRDIDNEIFLTLEQSNNAPKCYYACPNYRIQEFIQNCAHPTNEELKDERLKKKVLKALHRYHQNEVKMLKSEPLFVQEVFSNGYFQKIKAHKDKSVNANFMKLYTLVESEYEFIDLLKQTLIQENPQEAKKKIKFCHNDLNNLNIFSKPDVLLIDYEYSSYNYVYYDVANFLNECNINYSVKEFPKFRVEKKLTWEEIETAAKLYPETYPGFEKDILKGLVACNLYWAAWSIIMAYDPSQGNFGTVEHGLARMDLYNYYKKMMSIHL